MSSLELIAPYKTPFKDRNIFALIHFTSISLTDLTLCNITDPSQPMNVLRADKENNNILKSLQKKGNLLELFTNPSGHVI